MNDFIFGQLGVQIIHFVQSFSSTIPDLFFIIITNFGNVPFYLVILALIYWFVSKKIGAHLAAALIIFGYFTELIKAYVGWTRPYIAEPSEVKLIGPKPIGYSFPSGHAQSTGTFWPVLINRCTDPRRRKILIPIAVAFLIIIPFSRVYLGVHYPGDVTFGLLFGLLGAFLYIKLNEQVINIFKDIDINVLIAIIIILSIIMTLAEIAVTQLGRNSLSIATPGYLPGMFLGTLVGFLLENKFVKFVQQPEQKLFYLTRIVIGSVIVAFLFILMYLLFIFSSNDYLVILKHYLEFSFVGLGIAFIGPYGFTQFEEYWLRRSKT